METEKFKLKDIGYGLIVPLIIALVIVIFPAVLRPILDNAFPAPSMTDAGSPYAFVTVILTHGFAMMVVFAIPLILGLIWNKWAGGAAGFIMGTLYYVAFAGWNLVYTQNQYGGALVNFYKDPSFIGNYIVGGILIGYIAGSLNNKSMSFKRMLGASLTAAITVGVFQFILNYTVSIGAWMTQGDPGFSLFTAMLPMILLGVIAPIVAKVMTWFGVMPGGHY
ncbi:MAG TPA: hypothetical protein VJ066_04800 [Candidatus Bathyarchaeia archaeon]|nr:hypothetical protein [Candidatus Bathyarchaeia archaeon]